MTAIFRFLIAVVLIGDYLMLSVSRLALGSNHNWLLLVGIAQIGALVLAVLLGYGRSLRMSMPLLGMIGLGFVMLAHSIHHAIEVGDFNDYGSTKTLTFFLISGPAFLLGCVLGQCKTLPGTRWFPLLATPLLVMCILALTTDPGVMTIRSTENLAVFFGVLVLPVHQALAFSLGKIALWLHTTTQSPEPHRPRRIFTLGLIGFCVGMAVLSGSRGYLIAVVFGLAVQWWVGRRRFGLAFLAAGIPLLVFTAVSSETVRRGLDPTTVASSDSIQERLDLFRVAIAAFWESPVLGQGPGGFATYYGWEERVYPHDVFLEILSELGLVGLACFLLVLLPITVCAVRACARGSLTDVQFFSIGFLVFSVVGATGVADLIRNHFLFLAAGMTAAACTPTVVTAPSPAARTVTAT